MTLTGNVYPVITIFTKGGRYVQYDHQALSHFLYSPKEIVSVLSLND